MDAILKESGADDYAIELINRAGGIRSVLTHNGENFQDILDSMISSRTINVRNALRDLDWDGERYGSLSKEGVTADFKFVTCKGGYNNIGYSVNGITDYMDMPAAEFAALIEADRIAGKLPAHGPWTMQKSSDNFHGYADWSTFNVRDAKNHCIAVVGEVDRGPAKHNEATARLMAAAPELLNALVVMREEFRKHPDYDDNESLQSISQMAFQAICKAKGE